MNDTKNPNVAVIIINWNGKADTIACLDSLRNVKYDSMSVYVIDNASSDDSAEAIISAHPWIHLIRSDCNRYFAGGNNYGYNIAKKEKPDLVLFLNNDTVVEPNFLNHMVNVIMNEPSIGIVGPKIYHFDRPDVIWSAGGYIRFFMGKIGHYGLRQTDKGKWNKQRDVGYLTGCAQLIRADLFEKLGGFDKSYHMYSEDADLCQRVRLAGYRAVYVPQSKIWHKISSSSGGGMTAYKIHGKIRGNLKFFKKYAKWYHWLTIPFFVVIEGSVFIVKSIFTLNFTESARLIWSVFSVGREPRESKKH